MTHAVSSTARPQSRGACREEPIGKRGANVISARDRDRYNSVRHLRCGLSGDPALQSSGLGRVAMAWERRWQLDRHVGRLAHYACGAISVRLRPEEGLENNNELF